MNFRLFITVFSIAVIVSGLSGTGASRVNAQTGSDRLLTHDQRTGQRTGSRLALVIGNSTYRNAAHLNNPANDATDMVSLLTELGFKVLSGTNLSQREMRNLIREFGQNLKASGGAGLFYFAGHGVQSKGRNYLVPIDADIQSEAEVEDASVDVNLVLNYMEEAENELNIVILDACRNNPFARSYRSGTNGLAELEAPTGTLIAYATAPGRVASDGTGRNGLYTAELLKQMRVPGLSLPDMFMRVRAAVMKQTSKKQVPWESSSLVGSFYLRPTVPSDSTVPPGTVTDYKTDADAPRKRGEKSGKVVHLPGVINGNHTNKDIDAISAMLGEFSDPINSALQKVGLTVVTAGQISSRDIDQIIGVTNTLSTREPTSARGLSIAVYLDSSVSVKDLAQSSGTYITICRATFILIDLEEGKAITTYDTGELKGFGTNQEQARRNTLREAGSRIPRSFINQIKESAW